MDISYNGTGIIIFFKYVCIIISVIGGSHASDILVLLPVLMGVSVAWYNRSYIMRNTHLFAKYTFFFYFLSLSLSDIGCPSSHLLSLIRLVHPTGKVNCLSMTGQECGSLVHSEEPLMACHLPCLFN